VKATYKLLSEQDLASLNRLEEIYLHCLQTFAPELNEKPFDAKTIDIIFFRCNKQNHPFSYQIVPVTAYALGVHFINHLNYAWNINKDHLGEEYVLISNDGNHIVYPFSLVQQKFEKHECGFVVKLAAMYKELNESTL